MSCSLPRHAYLLLGSLTLAALPAFADGPATWTDVTSNVGGDKWGAYGVTLHEGRPQ